MCSSREFITEYFNVARHPNSRALELRETFTNIISARERNTHGASRAPGEPFLLVVYNCYCSAAEPADPPCNDIKDNTSLMAADELTACAFPHLQMYVLLRARWKILSLPLKTESWHLS